MKKPLLTAAAVVVLSSQAIAADLPSRKEPVDAPPPPLWTGFHIGVNAGGTWSNGGSGNVDALPITPVQDLPLATTNLNGNFSLGSSTGFIGGGQVGYDQQFTLANANFLAGVEADIQGIASSSGGGSSVSTFPGANPVRRPQDRGITTLSGGSSLNYIGTARGRIGYLIAPTLLVYGTGGLAFGDANLNFNSYQIYNSQTAKTWLYQAFGNGSSSGLQVGYAAGGGVEWMFLPNWSAKAEYLYYDLGTLSASNTMTRTPNRSIGANQQPPAVQTLWTVNSRLAGNIVRAGVNYHFNWGAAPVVARY